MKKPEITIQYFVDRGRRRTLTVSLQRLNTLLICTLVFCAWSLAVSGFFFYHLFTGKSFVAGVVVDQRIAPVVAVGPDQPARKKIEVVEVKAPPQGQASLSAKAIVPKAPEVEAPVPVITPTQPIYTLASLMNFESSLRKAETPDPLRFRNVRIALDGDHLRVSADIEKITGDVVEGHSFVAAEYLDEEGRSSLITSHGKKDWESAIAPQAFAGATSFKARILSRKRFDIVHPSNKNRKLMAVKLVAKDKKTGKTVVEAVSLPN